MRFVFLLFTWAHIKAKTGTLENMLLHGVVGKAVLRFNCPISILRYSRSSFEMCGLEAGSS